MIGDGGAHAVLPATHPKTVKSFTERIFGLIECGWQPMRDQARSLAGVVRLIGVIGVIGAQCHDEVIDG